MVVLQFDKVFYQKETARDFTGILLCKNVLFCLNIR